MVDLAFFVLMGLVGGLLGALFNCVNKGLAKYRIRHIHPKAKFIRWSRSHVHGLSAVPLRARCLKNPDTNFPPQREIITDYFFFLFL